MGPYGGGNCLFGQVRSIVSVKPGEDTLANLILPRPDIHELSRAASDQSVHEVCKCIDVLSERRKPLRSDCQFISTMGKVTWGH